MKLRIRDALDKSIIVSHDAECFEKCGTKSHSESLFAQKCKDNHWYCSKIFNGKIIETCFPSSFKRQKLASAMHAANDIALALTPKISQEVDTNNVTLHNVKNIHAGIVTKIESLLPEEEFIKQEDKTAYIKRKLQSNQDSFIRELLSIKKSIDQMQFHFTAYELLRAKGLSEQDFVEHKIHTLISMAWYQYDAELQAIDVKLNIAPSYQKCLVHFESVKSVFSAIFENCSKYCLPHSSVSVSYAETESHVEIRIEMTSREIPETNPDCLFEYEHRGKNATNLRGRGIGLWVANKMVQLNHGTISIAPGIRKQVKNHIWYAENIFCVRLIKNRLSLSNIYSKPQPN